MKLLDEYMKLREEIYEFFGFKEDWKDFPIDDRRGYYWRIVDGKVDYWINLGNVGKWLEDDGFQDEVYTHRFWDKWVYKSHGYTMIMVDTHCDDNKYLAIFDDDKEIEGN